MPESIFIFASYLWRDGGGYETLGATVFIDGRESFAGPAPLYRLEMYLKHKYDLRLWGGFFEEIEGVLICYHPQLL